MNSNYGWVCRAARVALLLLVGAALLPCGLSAHDGSGNSKEAKTPEAGAVPGKETQGVLASFWNISPGGRKRTPPEDSDENAGPWNLRSPAETRAYACTAALDGRVLRIEYEPGTLEFTPRAVIITEIMESKLDSLLWIRDLDNEHIVLADSRHKPVSLAVMWCSFDPCAQFADRNHAVTLMVFWDLAMDIHRGTIEVPVTAFDEKTAAALSSRRASIVVGFMSAIAPVVRAPSISVLSPTSEGK